jgi:hypothetical protein
MEIINYGDLIISSVNFQGENVNGEGDFFDGLTPTCWAEDDLTAEFGDPKEKSLAAALHYLENGACRPQLKFRSLSSRLQQGRGLPLEGFRLRVGTF